MPELRWTLLILGALFIGGLALWEWRRQRHARGPGGAAAPFGGASGGRDGERISPTFEGSGGHEGERISPTFDGVGGRAGERISPTFGGSGDGGAFADTSSSLAPSRGTFREPTLTFPDVAIEVPSDTRDRFADPPVVELDDESLDRLKVEAGEAVDEFSEPNEPGEAIDDFSEDLDTPAPAEPMIPKLSGVAAVPPTLAPAGQRMGGERLAGEREVGWGTGGEHTGGERASSERIGGGRASSGGRAEAAGERVAHGAAADESIRAERRTIERGAGGADERRFMERDGERATFDEHDEPTTRFDASESDTDAEPVSASAARVTSAPGATSASASPLATDPLQPVEPIVEWPEEDTRKIIALRLVSGIGERFPGRAVRLALAAEGFVLGKFDIFHKPGPDARAMLSAASLTKPGTFSLSTMDAQRFGGLSLFAVLPGPLSPLATFDELLTTARALNDRLRGALQDERGEPLTPMRSASIRESLGAAASASAPVVGAAAAPPVVGGSDTPSPP